MRAANGLVDDLERLASGLENQSSGSGGLRGTGTEETRDRLVRTIRSYLIPRLTEPEAPLCVVFAGPTGSGKSTLLNSLSGASISETGPIRPTTKSPVILAAEGSGHRFENLVGIECTVVTGKAPILNQMALVDTPDIDSTATEHRAMAESLIDCADVVVMVTSALRYADVVPWEVLRRAMSRGAPIIFVLNRVTSSSSGAMTDFRSRLAESGVEADIIGVPEHHLQVGGHAVPMIAVRELGRRLVMMARDRDRYQRETFQRVLDSTIAQVSDLADDLDREHNRVTEAHTGIRAAFENRADSLNLSSLLDAINFSEPPSQGRLRIRLWKRANRLANQDLMELEAFLRDRLTTIVESDLRVTLLSHNVLSFIGEGVEGAARGVHLITGEAVDGWFAMIHQVVDGIRKRDRNLAATALIFSAFGSGQTRAVGVFSQTDTDSLMEKVRLDLRHRLQVAYSQTGERLCELHGFVSDEQETNELQARLTGVVVRSHFADA